MADKQGYFFQGDLTFCRFRDPVAYGRIFAGALDYPADTEPGKENRIHFPILLFQFCDKIREQLISLDNDIFIILVIKENDRFDG